MFHIPPGIDGYSTMTSYRSLSQAADAGSRDVCSQAIVPMWKPLWTARFEQLVADFQTTIAAVFAGHDHTDDFRVIHAGHASQQFVLIDRRSPPIWTEPSLSGCQLHYRRRTGRPKHPLSDQPCSCPEHGSRHLEVSFAESWHSPRLDAASLNTIYNQIRSDPMASAQWLTLLNFSSAHAHVPRTVDPSVPLRHRPRQL